MPHFYTRTGDEGYTSLLGAGRVPKYHPQTEAVGAIDEANASLGMARAICHAPETGAIILIVQRDLYHLMAEVAANRENAPRFRSIDAQRIQWLEEKIDDISAQVEIPKEFIVPGDSPSGAAAAMARTLVRRAERRVAGLLHKDLVENYELLRYLNRLSSLCFVLELLENQAAGKEDPTIAKVERDP